MQTKDKQEKAIIDLVNGDSRFKRFGEFIKAAGLDKRLSEDKSLTVFAPTNEAFAKMPQELAVNMLKPENREQLRNRILLHVVPGALDINELTKAKVLKTEAGTEIRVDVSKDLKQIKLANANIVLPKEEAQNGMLYPVDAVLQPTSTTAAAA